MAIVSKEYMILRQLGKSPSDWAASCKVLPELGMPCKNLPDAGNALQRFPNVGNAWQDIAQVEQFLAWPLPCSWRKMPFVANFLHGSYICHPVR